MNIRTYNNDNMLVSLDSDERYDGLADLVCAICNCIDFNPAVLDIEETYYGNDYAGYAVCADTGLNVVFYDVMPADLDRLNAGKCARLIARPWEWDIRYDGHDYLAKWEISNVRDALRNLEPLPHVAGNRGDRGAYGHYGHDWHLMSYETEVISATAYRADGSFARSGDAIDHISARINWTGYSRVTLNHVCAFIHVLKQHCDDVRIVFGDEYDGAYVRVNEHMGRDIWRYLCAHTDIQGTAAYKAEFNRAYAIENGLSAA